MRVCPLDSATSQKAKIVAVVLATALILPAASSVHAQEIGESDPFRFVSWPAQDARALVGSVNANALAYLGVGALVFAIAQQDPTLHEAVVDVSPSPGSPVFRAVEEVGNVKLVRPATLMLFIGSLASSDERFQDAAFTSFESVLIANVVTSVLKAAFGRARPYQIDDPGHFDPFSGNSSFPSGHSATAFAMVTPWLLYYPSPWTAGMMVVAGTTAMSRVASSSHWVSDIVAGSTLGFATAYVLSRTHMNRSALFNVTPIVTDGGAGISVAVRP